MAETLKKPMPADISKSQSYYELLGIAADAPDEDVRRAYRRLALRHHPDLHKGPDRKIAELRFRLIHEAYAHLNTPQKRHTYNERLRAQNDNTRRSAGILGWLAEFFTQTDSRA